MTPLESNPSSTRIEDANQNDSTDQVDSLQLETYCFPETPGQTDGFNQESGLDLPELELVSDGEDESSNLSFEVFDTEGDFLSHPLLDSTEKSEEKHSDKGKESDGESDASRLKPQETEALSLVGIESNDKWSRASDGSWSFTAEDGSTEISIKGFDPAANKIQDVEKLEDESLKFSLDNGSVIRQRPDGSTIHFDGQDSFTRGEPSKIYKRDNSIVDLDWKDGNISRLRDSGGSSFTRLESGMYKESNSTWTGELSVNANNGAVTTRGTSDKVETTTSTDGSVMKKMPDGSLELSLKSSQDNVKRVFKFDASRAQNLDNLTQPTSMEVTNPDGKSSLWQHQEGNKFKVGGSVRPAQISVERNAAGEYQYNYEQLDNGYTKSVSNHSLESKVAGRDEVRTEKDGKLTGIEYGDSTYQVRYDQEGEPHRLEDLSGNRAWTKQSDGKWQVEALEAGKPFDKPNQFESDLLNHSELSVEQKLRMIDNTRKINQRDDIDQGEKTVFFENANRLLEPKEGTAFTSKERAELADQLLWHTANSTQNDQGSSLTCNVTTLRGIFLQEQPSVVAKLVSDVANDGQLVTKDGSVIKPPLDSLKPRNNSEEQTFPPQDGKRSWLGQVWDVSAANIHYQRQTKDITGATVQKGSVSYKLVPKQGQSDHGERIVKVDQSGREWTLKKLLSNNTTKSYDGVHLTSSNILGIYDQLTEDNKEELLVMDSSRGVDDKDAFDDLGGKQVSNLQELHDYLSKADFPVIVELNSGVLSENNAKRKALLKGEDPSSVQPRVGGPHVVLVNGYDPGENGSVGAGTVCLDNSWGSLHDYDTAKELIDDGQTPHDATTISVDELMKAMKMKSKARASGQRTTWTWVYPG